MTLYEILKTIPMDTLRHMVAAGIIPKNTVRNVEIFDTYLDMVRCETPTMKIYDDLAEYYELSSNNIRLIIRSMKQYVK